MAKTQERKTLDRKGWVENFELVGRVKLLENSYKINERSTKSDWIYNSMIIGIDCGEKHGVIYPEMMGGYGAERENYVYSYGKDDNGKLSTDNKMTIDWEDRLNNDIVSEVADVLLYTVGLEKSKDDKTVYKKFLTEYDAIAYIKEYLKDGDIVRVKGDLVYDTYNGSVTIKKKIKSIVLSTIEMESQFKAEFTQTLLLDKYSIMDKDLKKKSATIMGMLLKYYKEYNKTEVKGFLPLVKQFEFEMSEVDEERFDKALKKLFKVDKDVTQATFKGILIESGSTILPTYDDLTDDVKELIDMGIMTEEEAIKECAVSGNKIKRMVITKPYLKSVTIDGGEIKKEIDRIDRKYSEDDLFFEFMLPSEEVDDEEIEEVFEKKTETKKTTKKEKIEEVEEEDDDSWLNDLE